MIAVGCPVFQRGWILERWFDSVESQGFGEVSYHFVYTPGDDDTLDIIRRRAPFARVHIADDLPSFGNDQRMNPERYEVLAELRNRLLDSVARTRASAFVSWDSDILLPAGYGQALWTGQPVTGALLDMTGVNWLMTFPSVMDFDGKGGATRRDGFSPDGEPIPFEERYGSGGLVPFKVDVVMAVKIMLPEVFRKVRYVSHPLGEDIGFCYRCEELGLDRYVAPAVLAEHHHDEPDA